eukprot:Tbor_TRINITY_DN6055_c1_g3::TRINITY_DN6055_c1_g3_i3::g.10578::m.10578
MERPAKDAESAKRALGAVKAKDKDGAHTNKGVTPAAGAKVSSAPVANDVTDPNDKTDVATLGDQKDKDKPANGADAHKEVTDTGRNPIAATGARGTGQPDTDTGR